MKMTSLFVAAAMGGVMAGVVGCADNKPMPASDPSTTTAAPSTPSTGAMPAAPAAKHACKGQNACKGQGGCKTA